MDEMYSYLLKYHFLMGGPDFGPDGSLRDCLKSPEACCRDCFWLFGKAGARHPGLGPVGHCIDGRKSVGWLWGFMARRRGWFPIPASRPESVP